MKVSAFMVPADQVVSVGPHDTVQTVMAVMLGRNIGTVVVMEQPKSEETGLVADAEQRDDDPNKVWPMPLGILTKSDIVQAYKTGVPIDSYCEAIMNTTRDTLITCSPNTSRDKAAELLENIHTHHLLVVDNDTDADNPRFVGLLSSWDIAAECARDDHAWPWLRSADGKFHTPFPPKPVPPAAVESDEEEDGRPTILHHHHDKNTTYEDFLDVLQFQ